MDAPAEQIEADKALMGNLTNRELAAMVMAQLLCADACEENENKGYNLIEKGFNTHLHE